MNDEILRDALMEVFHMIDDVRTGKVKRGVNFYLADAQVVVIEALEKCKANLERALGETQEEKSE